MGLHHRYVYQIQRKSLLIEMGEGTKKHVIADISSPNPNLKVKVHKSYVWLTAPSICYICIWQLLLAPPPQITLNKDAAKIVQILQPKKRYRHLSHLNKYYKSVYNR